jgi:ABC-type sugar transport system ATPase subunit
MEAREVSKRFPGVQALDRVSFDVARGEIHSLVGENGAGKSTLVKLLSGLLQPDAGFILLDRGSTTLHSPWQARKRGISVIPQEVLAVPKLSVGRNVLLGREGFWVRKDQLTANEDRAVRQALERAGGEFAPQERAEQLGVQELRVSQIAKTLTDPGEVIVLDEPTSVLSEADAELLLQRLLRLRGEGKAIVYVSHRLSEVLRISDRITVLRDGRTGGTFARGESSRDELVGLMARATVNAEHRPTSSARTTAEEGSLVLARDLSGPGFVGVDLEVRPREVVGIAGMQGAGHAPLLRSIAGVLPYERGELLIDGASLPAGSLREAYRRGLVLLPADRRREAIVPHRSLRDNVVLPVNSGHALRGLRRLRRERSVARGHVVRLGIRAPTIETLAGALSGGNQQKLALARALESRARVLLLEEPSQGIDIHSKREIRHLIREVAGQGARGVLVASSEVEELLEVADGIYVMRLGRIVARLAATEATYGEVLHHALP